MRDLRSVLAVGTSGAVVLVAGVVTAAVGLGPTPKDVATDFLTDLSAGHVSKALALVAHEGGVDRTLLTKDLPAADRITHAKVGAVTTKSDRATVSVTYELDQTPQSATLRLSKHGGEWRIDNGLSSLVIDGAAPDVTALTVNGITVKVSSGGAEVPALPGLYNAAMPATFAFVAKGQKSPVTTDPGALHFDLVATAAGKSAASTAVLNALKACLAKKPQVIEDPCHANTATITDKGDFKNSDFRWRLLKDPAVTAYASGTSYYVSSTAAGKAEVSVFAVDLKNRFPPQRIALPTSISLKGVATVTFTGRTPHVTY